MIQLDLQPEIEAQLAVEARARGLALDRYLETIVLSRSDAQPTAEPPTEAVAAIRQLRKGNRLEGVRVSELIEQGRRY